MAFRGQPQTLEEIVAWVQEQLRAIQAPVAGGTFRGPPGLDGDPGPPGPPDPDNDVWRWAEVSP